MKRSERLAAMDEKKTVRLTRSKLIQFFKGNGKVPLDAKFVTVEVERGDEVFNINEVDGLVVSWGP